MKDQAMTNQFYDLSFERSEDGTITLHQMDYAGESATIAMHPAQLRYVAEHFDVIRIGPPADELTKRLAQRLCQTFLLMCDEYRHLSHELEEEHARLDEFITTLPNDIMPWHLWEERDAKKEAREAERRASAQSKTSGNSKPLAEAENGPTSPQMALLPENSEKEQG
ncbi:hypothetical protein [Herbaspirillum seropedicae]|uniref:hypothetical protein n=1 Tax=Herbaspirillum seropedicae TaxID=964 RepID=UPI0012EA9458|nr:hypothetical protein [Herbaspirillum seropedicae]